MSVLDQYRQRIHRGELTPDPAQAYAAEQLQLLAVRLSNWEAARGRRVLNLIFNRDIEVPRGLYIFGGVGRGKTMLMDLFFEQIDIERKKRVHYHPFMREVHSLIKQLRKEGEGDPIPKVAARMMERARLLCLDEMHVNDITDAMILGRLFNAMFEKELVVVTTSNAAPRELYKDGLNRQLFMPFIELVEQKMDVLQLESPKDYRYDVYQHAPHYLAPAGPAAHAEMDRMWLEWAGHARPHGGFITVNGREVIIPAMGGGMARFQFGDLCEQPLGTHDYLALCEHFHTFFIENVPVLTPARRNEARRFINLIDTLYDQKKRLVMSAAAEPQALYPEGAGAIEFERTASRLNEMRGSDWPGV